MDDDPNNVQSTLDLTTLAAKVVLSKSFLGFRCTVTPPLIGKLYQQHAYIGSFCQ